MKHYMFDGYEICNLYMDNIQKFAEFMNIINRKYNNNGKMLVVPYFIGAILIIFSNIFVFYEKGKLKVNKYVLLGVVANLTYTVASLLDVNYSDSFALPIYLSATLILPAILILIFEKIKIKDIKNEMKDGNRKFIFITGICWGFSAVFQLRAYQLGEVTTVAPLCAITTILNVLAGYIFLKERDNLLKKIIAAILIVISVVLIKL